MKTPHFHVFVLWAFLTSLVIGCTGGLTPILSTLAPTVDLSGASAEKSNLSNYCNCITRVARETDEEEELWNSIGKSAAGFVLSPGRLSFLKTTSAAEPLAFPTEAG